MMYDIFCCNFTGNETKLGMSKGIAEPKLTAADAMLDRLTTTIFIFQIVVVLILGVAGNIWNNYEKEKVCANGNGMESLEGILDIKRHPFTSVYNLETLPTVSYIFN